MAVIVVQQSFEQELSPRSLLTEGHGCTRQLHLHLLEEIAVEDRRMLPGVAVTVMIDLAEIDSVLQEVGQRAARPKTMPPT